VAFEEASEAAGEAKTAELEPLSWRAVALYSAGNFGASAVAAFGNAALPLYLAGYGASNVVIGFLAQERSFVGGLVQPLVGALSDRTRSRLGRRRPFFLVGVPLVVLTLLVLATHPPFWVVVALLSVLAFFLAVAYDPYLALLPDLVPTEQRGRVGGMLAVTNMLGQMALLAAASVLWGTNERLVFALVAIAITVGFGITFIGVREPPTGDGAFGRPAPVGAGQDPPLRGFSHLVGYLKDVLGHRELAKYVGVTGLFWLGTGGVVPFLTRYGVDELGVDSATAFRLLLVAVASTAVFAMPAGALGDRFGKRRVLMVGLFGYGAGCLAGAVAQSAGQAFVILAAVGVANAACTVLLFPLLADLLPRHRAGELTGLGSAIWSIAQPLGAVAAGLVADLTGSLRGPLAVAGLLTLASCALLTRVRHSS
jgi:Na+/melibiose symporter-like transporter